MLESNMKKLNVLHNLCLRKICGIILNKELCKKTSSSRISDQVLTHEMARTCPPHGPAGDT